MKAPARHTNSFIHRWDSQLFEGLALRRTVSLQPVQVEMCLPHKQPTLSSLAFGLFATIL